MIKNHSLTKHQLNMKASKPPRHFFMSAFVFLGARLTNFQKKALKDIEDYFCDFNRNNTIFYGVLPEKEDYEMSPEAATTLYGNHYLNYDDVVLYQNEKNLVLQRKNFAFISLTASLAESEDMMDIFNCAEMFTGQRIIFQYLTTPLNKSDHLSFDPDESDDRLEKYKNFLKERCGGVTLSNYYRNEPHPYKFMSFIEVEKIETDISLFFMQGGNLIVGDNTHEGTQPISLVLHTVILKKINITAQMLAQHFKKMGQTPF